MKRIFVVGARGIPDVEGGAEKNAERLFPRIAAKGWDVTVAGLRQYLKGTDYRGVHLWGAPASRLLKTDKLAYYVAALRKARRLRPDIVHMQGLGAALFLWAYRLMGCRTVVRYGSADYILGKWGVLGQAGFRLAEYQLRYADAVIAVAPALVERLRQVGVTDNVHLIPNATDDPSDFGSEDVDRIEEPYVLTVGRVTMQKNVHRLIEGFKLFADAHPGIRLAVAGGIDDPAYMEQIEPLLDDRIVMLGRLPRSAMGGLYRKAQIYVNASIHEGNSNAVLEAISWRCPLLLSDIPENRDFGVGDKHYFPPDDPAAIAAALERAYRDTEAYRASPSDFPSWADVADRTEAVYQAILTNPVGAPAYAAG